MAKLHMLLCTGVLLLLAVSAAEAAPRQEILHGPMTGEVLQVLDGDTLSVKIRIWIGQEIETSVRIDGIDAPEIKGKCAHERTMAAAAQRELLRLIDNKTIRIYNVRLEKYAGRVLAQAETSSGINISRHLLEKGLVRPYHGEKRQPWCA